MDDLRDYLLPTEVVDWRHPRVLAKARELAVAGDVVETARRCFEFVRDEVKHSWDHQLDPVTCNASDVLAEGTGYCFAKSHLLAALLRANAIPAGFCYQRLLIDEPGGGYSLHGFNAVHLGEGGWYRIDPRGNKPGVDARFEPPAEHLAYTPSVDGEFTLPGIYSHPLANVLEALHLYSEWDVFAANLPDMHPDAIEELREALAKQ